MVGARVRHRNGAQRSGTSFAAVSANAKSFAHSARRRMHFYMLRTRGFGVAAAKFLSGDRSESEPLALHQGPARLPQWRRDYLFLQPVNGVYDKWFADRISTVKLFSEGTELFQPLHYNILDRDGSVLVVPLSSTAAEYPASAQGIMEMVRRNGPLILCSSQWSEMASTEVHVGYGENGLEVDGEPISLSEFNTILHDHVGANESSVIVAPLDGGPLRHYVYASLEGATAELVPLGEGSPHDAEAGHQQFATQLFESCLKVPQLELGLFAVGEVEGAPRVVSVSGAPGPDVVPHLSESTRESLAKRARVKALLNDRSRSLRRWAKYGGRRVRKEFARAAYPQGLVPYQSTRWLRDVFRDLTSDTGVSLTEKIWAYRHGFLSYRIPQYGITKTNREDFISDLEYRWLRHINGPYRIWVEQKPTMRQLLPEHADFFPKNYYTTPTFAGSCLRRMPDLPDGYGINYADMLRLVREEGVLALKPESGSHGEGFKKLEFSGGAYLLNGRPSSENDVVALLSQPENKYLVTEYIVQHPELRKYHSESVNTVRLTVFKSDGMTPELGNAYLRLGSPESGYVDNVVAGAMIAEIDLGTGRYHSGAVLSKGRMCSSPDHPGSGLRVEGTIPGWEQIKDAVLAVAEALPQLEYLGFDVAVTSDGFRVIEINRFPDFPRTSLLTRGTIGYLIDKVAAKKALTQTLQKGHRTLIRLPQRSPRTGLSSRPKDVLTRP